MPAKYYFMPIQIIANYIFIRQGFKFSLLFDKEEERCVTTQITVLKDYYYLLISAFALSLLSRFLLLAICYLFSVKRSQDIGFLWLWSTTKNKQTFHFQKQNSFVWSQYRISFMHWKVRTTSPNVIFICGSDWNEV